ncbi:MAG: manganese efflux pump MntP family protein [Candidatus Humimicrobiaceae bacterium]
MLNIFLISTSLAMDCFAVSIAGGANSRKLRFLDALKVAFWFGFFQAVMPLIGWLVGFSLKSFIERFDHWVAFGLLFIIGIKMIYEAFKDAGKREKINFLKIPTLLLLSVATSIDALAVGITFSLLDMQLLLSVGIIGMFAFIFSIAGYFIGHRLGHFFESKVEAVGGIILIGIGIKILIEHLM